MVHLAAPPPVPSLSGPAQRPGDSRGPASSRPRRGGGAATTSAEGVTLAAVLAEVRALRAESARLHQLVAPLATRQLSRKQQAKKAGVHPSTLWRREQRAAAALALASLNHGVG